MPAPTNNNQNPSPSFPQTASPIPLGIPSLNPAFAKPNEGPQNLDSQHAKKFGALKKSDSTNSKDKPKFSYLEQQDFKEILLDIGKLLLSMQIYKLEHPLVAVKLKGLVDLMLRVIDKYGKLVLSARDDLIFLNGYQERVTGGPLQKLIDTLKSFRVSSFEMEKGVSAEELTLFFRALVIRRREREKEKSDIKDLLGKENITHVKPVFLQYIEVDDTPKDVPEPKNLPEVIKGYRKGAVPSGQEQLVTDFLKGKTDALPKKVDTFLLNHPKLAAMALIKLIDEFEIQNLDSFSAFQAYVQSLTHYMARLSRLLGNPDKVAQTLEKLEKHLVLRLKSLKKDKKFIEEVKEQVKDSLSWVAIEQLVHSYKIAKENLILEEEKIIEAIEKRKVPSVAEIKERLKQVGIFQSKLSIYLK